MACKTQVTTSSGTFTFHDQAVKRCEAKKMCSGAGEILAPVENKEDLSALLQLTEQKCGMFADRPSFFTGLDIAVCEEDEDKVFTDGAKWDPKIHGPLYRWDKYAQYADVRYALLTDAEKVKIIGDFSCGDMKANFVCLKPAKPTGESEALLKNSDLHSFNNLAFLAFAIPTVAFFFAVGVAVKFYRRNRVLEEEKRSMLN